jgi:hypothetical protein
MPPIIQNTKQPDRRIIALCPISKIFNPYEEIDAYLDNPSLVEEKPERLGGKGKDIVIQVPLSSKTYEFIVGQAYTVSAEEALMLVGVQNGHWSQMTNGTGLVYFDIPDDELSAFEYATKQKQKIPKELQARIDECLKKAEEWSRKRVMDYLKKLFNDITQGRASLRQAGGEPPPPNDHEMLYTFILKEHIKETKNKRRQLAEAFREATSEISQDDLLSL